MASIETFHKIKDLRNREKQEHQKSYQRAVATFRRESDQAL